MVDVYRSIPDRPSRDRMLLDIAHVVSRRSTCSRAQVGAVLALDSRVLSMGYNGSPSGTPHCKHLLTDPEPCVDAVHAEANALAYAARHGTSVGGATLYTTLSPCLACAALMIQAGVKRVVYAVKYRTNTGLLLLDDAGIMVVHVPST